MKQGKKYVDSVKLIDSTKAYDSSEALDLVCRIISPERGFRVIGRVL